MRAIGCASGRDSGGSVTQWLVSGELCIFADIARQYRHWALWTQARSCKCDGRERSQFRANCSA